MQISEILEEVTFEEPTALSRLAGSLAEIYRTAFAPGSRAALAYLAALAAAEALTSLTAPRPGMVLHGLLLLALLAHASLWASGVQQRFLLALALAPLIRLLSLSMPLAQFPMVAWYALVGAPLFLAGILAARQGRMSRGMLGLTLQALPAQLLIGLSGVGLGLLEYLILRPEPLAPAFGWRQILLPALALLVFTGLLEEFIFRGVMQYAALVSLGRFGLIYVPAVFAVLHLGYRSALDVLFVFGVALFFGWAVQRTGSILGVTLSHGLTNIGLFLVFPFLLARPQAPVSLPAAPPPGAGAPAAAATVEPYMYLPLPAPFLPPVPTATLASPAETQPALVPAGTTTAAAPTNVPTATATLTETAAPTATFAEPTPLPAAPASEGASAPPEAAPPGPPAPQNTEPCGPPSGWVIYTVRRGDTLSSLSRSFGVSLEALRRANCLKDANRIYTGQRLWVPYLVPVLPWTPTFTPVVVPTNPPPTAVPPTAVAPEPSPAPTALPTEAPPPTEAPTPADPHPTEAPPVEPPPADPPPPEPAPAEPPPAATEPPT